MRTAILALLVTTALSACGDPVAEQARFDTRYDPVKADTMLAFGFRPGVSQPDAVQINELRSMVNASQQAERSDFVVVTDGSGGPMQEVRAEKLKQGLSAAGARWVGTALEPSMPMGPDSVVVVRSEYRIAMRNCPNYNPSGQWNPNESAQPGLGCADAYNIGQTLARPRDAAVGRPGGYADATVNAAAIQRYREGKVRTAGSSTGGASSTINLVNSGDSSGGAAGAGGVGGGGGAPSTPTSTY
jgi:type IV pilus biogenesis protein CpaD/CtpE